MSAAVSLPPIDLRAEFGALPRQTRDALVFWISTIFVASTKPYDRTSYGIKHSFERDAHVYVRSEPFAGAMLACGFEVAKIYPSLDGQNTSFFVRPRLRPRRSRASALASWTWSPESMSHATKSERELFAELARRARRA